MIIWCEMGYGGGHNVFILDVRENDNALRIYLHDVKFLNTPKPFVTLFLEDFKPHNRKNFRSARGGRC